MYRIGELSKLSNIPVKTLRFYDMEGILPADFTDAFTDAVEDKQVAEQTKLRTEIEQAQLLVVAQTDAERRVIAASLTEQLVAYQEIQQWDGALPSVYGASDPLPVLDMTDSLANDTAE